MRNKDAIIIKFLIEQRNNELNIRNISKALKMDYKNVFTIIKRLEKESLIKLEPFGNSNRIRFISQVHPIIFEAEFYRRKELLKDRNIAVMLNEFKNLIKSKCYILLLFGSYVKKKQARNSDVDLMFIVPDEREEFFEKEVIRAVKSFPLPIHHLIFSEKQFLEMINDKKSNVGKEALNNNIILFGIEAFYEMI